MRRSRGPRAPPRQAPAPPALPRTPPALPRTPPPRRPPALPRTQARLAPPLGKPVLTVLAKVTKPHTGFVYLAHELSADRATQIMRLQINGISTIPQVTRVYPRDWTASQVIGNVGWGDRGLSGLEYRYNGVLRGANGVRRIVNDAIGQPISIDNVRPMKPGKALKLTIDSALQDEVEQVLAGVGAQYSP